MALKKNKGSNINRILILLGSIGIMELLIDQWLNIYTWVPIKIKLLTVVLYLIIIILSFKRWKPILTILALLSPIILFFNISAFLTWGKIVLQSLMQLENIHYYMLSLLATVSSLLQILMVTTAIMGIMIWRKESQK